MLDDLKLIHERDPQDALGIAEKEWQQLEHHFEFTLQPFDIENVVLAGMGGSALAGLISMVWPGYKVPFQIVRDYSIPSYVSNKTLFIADSYSGNTEETVSALEEAEKAGAHIVVIAGGGKLQQRAEEKGHPFILLPKASQPRYAVFYNLKAIVTLLEKVGLLSTGQAEQELHQAAEFLKTSIENWKPTVPTAQNEAKRIALECIGKSVVVYGGPLMSPAAYKWKISFNENAKQVAWWNEYSEFNHNEFIGWTRQPVDKPYSVIDLRSNLENPRVLKRFELSAKLLSGVRPEPIVISPEGETLLEQLLWLVSLGDFTTIYTAILNNVNPTPVELVERLKKELG